MEEIGVVLIVSVAWSAVCALAIAFCAVSSRADKGAQAGFVWVRSTDLKTAGETPRRTGRFSRAPRARAGMPVGS